jgi:hypothetical protein
MPEHHWTEDADRTCSGSRFLIGEDEGGYWLVRRIWRDVYRPIEWWNPLHWLAYIGSRATNQLVWLEREDRRA